MLKLTRRLDINARTAFAQLMSIFPEGPGHPPGEARIRALRGGERVYPVSAMEAVACAAPSCRDR